MIADSEEPTRGPRQVRAIRTEIYSRVVGYYRPVQDWNKGKQEEFRERAYVSYDRPPVEEDGRQAEPGS